jgi:hypothetical protein
MMTLKLLLVFAALVNTATGSVIEENTPPTVGTPPVELGAAGNYVILAKSGISTVSDSNISGDDIITKAVSTSDSSIYGDVAVSPIAATAMTGFDMVLDSSGQWSTSSQINGKAYADDYATPTRSDLTTAVSDMETAYTDAAGRPNTDAARKNVGGGDISGEILTPGVYTFDTDIHFSADIAFQGGVDDVFILQTTGNLAQAQNTKVNLGGVQAKNIFWQVAGNVKVGVNAQLQGVILTKTDVAFLKGSSLNGRVLAQTACNLHNALIMESYETEL